MTKLCLLADMYGSDKHKKHHYTEIYDNLFNKIKKKPLKILEIGVDKGASINMWADYFPNAHIYGLDKDLRKAKINPFSKNRVTLYQGHQSDKNVLDRLTTGLRYDIVIDDGSHRTDDQIITFHAFLPDMPKYYIIEDLDCRRLGNNNNDLFKFINNILGSKAKKYGNSLVIIENERIKL